MAVDYQGLFEVVKTKIFDDIFNYTNITLKNNVKLTILNNGKKARSMVSNNIITTLLPDTTNRYYLFACDNVVISNLLAKTVDWVSMEDVLNENKVNADFVTENNRMLAKRMIFGRAENAGFTVFAVDVRLYNQLGVPPDTYMVINIDTNLVGERTVISHIPGVHENYAAILSSFNTYQSHQRIGFINGYAYRDDIFLTIGDHTTDYYELYNDGNVEFSFEVDLTHRNTYESSEESLYKDIIIIPKDLINNGVFTYDTISVIVFDENGKGIYLPFLATQSVSQLTHACFSISSYLIDAAFDKLNVTTGKLLVIASNYSKNNENVMNGSITEQLYTLDDTTILNTMLGTGNPDVPYWYADALEKRMYGKFLVDISPMDTYSTDRIRDQIECLGYYSFVNTICKVNGDLKDLGSSVSNLTMNVPIFWTDTDVYPILYLDGIKINHDRYDITRTDDVLSIDFPTPLVIDFSYSIIHYELIITPEIKTYIRDVTIDAHSFTIPKHDGDIRVLHLVSAVTLGLTDEEYPGYEEVDTFYSIIDSGDSYILSFNPSAYGHRFIIVFPNITAINYHPNVNIDTGETLCFVPYTSTDGDNTNIFETGEYEVYLNSRFMVRGIDYSVNEITNASGNQGGYLIVIQNLKFLDDIDNSVDIYKTGRVVITSDIGYVVDGIIPKKPSNETWIEGISRLFINGRAVPFDSVTVYPTHYEIASSYCGNGYIYQFIVSVPQDLHDAYIDYIDPTYLNGRVEVCNFFTNDYHYTYPDTIVISYGNTLYSSYLNELIKRIKNRDITVNYINDDTDIRNQVIAYEHLKDYDVIFNDDKIDKRFVDLYPTYLATIEIDDLNLYLYIQRLVKIVLGTDEITDHRIVYTIGDDTPI